MADARKRSYRVAFTTWSAYAAWIDAATEDDAIAIAEALYEAQGDAAFEATDGGLNLFFVLDAREGS